MTLLAWHFLRADGRLRGAADTDPPVKAGDVHTHDGPLVLCESGLHASILVLDALEYAPGPICCRVECGGKTIRGDDKIVCRERCVLWVINASRVLREFACDCAERTLLRERAAGREPDAKSWAAVDVARRFARGEATAAELKEARAAARSAVDAALAAGDAAWAAARAAAWDAAWDAARAAARAAARSAGDAAWDAAWAAEREWQEDALIAALERAAGAAETEREP